jgi:hypothetical protein
MRFVILHYHIFKNAGTTIEHLLERNFPGQVARLEGNDSAGRVPNEQLLRLLDERPEVRAVTSHQLRYPKPQAREMVFFDVCFLRDPVDRVRSMYEFYRRGAPEGDYLGMLARVSTLGEFIARLVEEHPHIVNDAQVNMLATDGAYVRPPGPEDLQRAARTVVEASFPGVVDRWAESMVAAEYFWHPAFPGFRAAEPAANVTCPARSTLAERREEVRAACETRVHEALLKLNQLDLELLERARAEVARRFALVPEGAARVRALWARTRELAGAAEPDGEPGHEQAGPLAALFEKLRLRRRATAG